MLHEPAAKQGPDPASSYKARLGVWMFVIYSLVYGGFVAVNLLAPAAMEATVLMGMNLAVVYGMGLIVLALVLALVYNGFCQARERELAGTGQGGE
ncbi:MAG TPA: DUF485 domain-containing protein [Myxococcota bacterium]|nr:DUF485 domain-containing protein [Myxococcota bacterium]HQK50380.1 DUF485 domain-containing protein [Myxococcota bacterium]